MLSGERQSSDVTQKAGTTSEICLDNSPIGGELFLEDKVLYMQMGNDTEVCSTFL